MIKCKNCDYVTSDDANFCPCAAAGLKLMRKRGKAIPPNMRGADP